VFANYLTQKGQPWEALQAQAFDMTQSQNAALRESAFRLFVGTRMLGIGQTDVVLTVLKDGLEDKESVLVSSSTHLFILSEHCGNLRSISGSSLGSTRIGDFSFVLRQPQGCSVSLPPLSNARYAFFCSTISLFRVHILYVSTCEA
jgi:hypothetical protein